MVVSCSMKNALVVLLLLGSISSRVQFNKFTASN